MISSCKRRILARLTWKKASGFLSHVKRALFRHCQKITYFKLAHHRYRRELRKWQLSKWANLDASGYKKFFAQCGGSIHVHPDVVNMLSEIRGLEPEFRGLYDGNNIVAALPLWPEGIVGSQSTLKAAAQSNVMDIGDAELILPIDPRYGRRIWIPGGAEMISAIHLREISGLVASELPQTLARGHTTGPNPLSNRTLSRRRNEIKKFIGAGGSIRKIGEFSPESLAGMYRTTFIQQRLTPPLGNDYLEQVFTRLRGLMAGHVLLHNDSVAAIQIIYAYETPRALLVDYVNGATNPELRDKLNPGSILGFLNVQSMEHRALAMKIPMRYCYGWADGTYKNTICNPAPMYFC